LRQFTHGTLAGLVALRLELHQIVETNPSVLSGSVVGQCAGLELFDEVRSRNIQQVGGFLGRQFGMHGYTRTALPAASSARVGALTAQRSGTATKHVSSATFANMTVSQWVDPASGAGGSGIICLSSSECSFSTTTVSGTPSGDPITPSIGIQAASASRFNFTSGRISGFDYGVHVWNNATAFFNPDCNNLSIDSNVSIGIYVRDGGIVKLEGSTPDASSAACPGSVLISNNGRYGVLAEGGGTAFLYRAQVTGHSIDSVRVQNGSVAKIRSSTIDAATGSHRSARVSGQAHLWFNEEAYGPKAGSTLVGPVCVANNSSVDTENSSTELRTVDRCTGP
jgi:hypothetical protein